MIEGIKAAVTIPVMAKARIGHFVEAQILEALGVDYVDESEVLTPADEAHHIDKWAFTVPFVCGATNLGEALRRISEGACMIRSKGEAGTGNIVEAVRHLRSILGDIRKITQADSAELYDWAKQLQAPLELVQEVAETRRAARAAVLRRRHRHAGRRRARDAARRAGGVRRARASSRAPNPPARAKAIVEATTHFRDAAHRRQGEPRARRGDAGPGDRRRSTSSSPSGAGSRHRAVDVARPPGRRSACSRCRARSARTPTCSLRSAPTRSRSARPRSSRGVDALVHARRRVDHDVACCSSRRACSTRCAERLRRRPAGARHLRRDDPAGARGARRPARPAHASAPSTSTVRRNGYGRQVDSLRGRPRRRRPRRRPVPAVFIRAPGRRARSAPASRCWPTHDGRAGARAARAPIIVAVVPSRAVGRPPAPRSCFLQEVCS